MDIRVSKDKKSFTVRIPSGLRYTLSNLAARVGTKGTLVGVATSLRSRDAYARFTR